MEQFKPSLNYLYSTDEVFEVVYHSTRCWDGDNFTTYFYNSWVDSYYG